MKIAITGSRGIPNNYGGFEQCAERLAVLLVKSGHDVTVYNPKYHPYSSNNFNGVEIISCWNPEKKIGTAGNFIYDYLCMRNALKNQCDILLVLGYTTASVFFPFLRKRKSILITNMDGLEWKRDKWNSAIKKLAKWFESLGARHSDYLVADNREIKNYLQKEYKKEATFIAYGAEIPEVPEEKTLLNYSVNTRNYDLLIARLEKENNVETILDGVAASSIKTKTLVVGNSGTPYGQFLVNKFKSYPHIFFTGGIYNQDHLNALRYYSRFYFHGHSVGGTNPSLLEAMSTSAYIVAHDNLFNKDVLGDNAFYFASADEVKNILNNSSLLEPSREKFVSANLEKIRNQYNWRKIAKEYEDLFISVLK